MDIPSDIGYKDQGLTPEELRDGHRVDVARGEGIPSDIGYKDLALTPEELRAGQRVDILGVEGGVCQGGGRGGDGTALRLPSKHISGGTTANTRGSDSVNNVFAEQPLIVTATPIAVPIFAPPMPREAARDAVVNSRDSRNQNFPSSSCKRGKKCWLMIGAIAVALSVALGVGMWAFLSGDDDDDDDDGDEFFLTTSAPPTASPFSTERPIVVTSPPGTTVPPTRVPVISTSNVWQQLGQDIDGEAPGDLFGARVAISADGTTIAAGASKNDDAGTDAGHVRVFRYNSAFGNWQQIGQDLDGVAAGDGFGLTELKLSADGSIVAAGADNFDGFNATDGGHARVFRYDSVSNVWVQLGQDLNGENVNDYDFFGYAIGLSADGTAVAAGAVNRRSGSTITGGVIAFAYNAMADRWAQLGQEMLGVAEEHFGKRVAMSADGFTVAASAYTHSSDPVLPPVVRVYRYSLLRKRWEQLGQDLQGEVLKDRFGSALSLSSDGSILAVGEVFYGTSNTGRVHVYEWNTPTSEWQTLGQTLVGESAGDYYGWTVSLSSNGTILATGAQNHAGNLLDNAGRVYVYELDRGINEWVPLGQFLDGDAAADYFGVSVALSADGNTLVAGAYRNNGNGIDSGHVRVFEYIP